MQKVRVAVIRGGLSDEYSISLETGAVVLQSIDRKIFDPLDVVISKSGEWLLDGRVHLPENIFNHIDVVFNALHGAYGEDGTLQRLLDRFAVPYTGSKAFASRIAMNKVLTKKYLSSTSIKTPAFMRVTKDFSNSIPHIVQQIQNLFGPRYVLKPVASGSSIGVTIVDSMTQLESSLTGLLDAYDDVIIEEFIQGRDVSCGIIEQYRGSEMYALPPVEVCFPTDDRNKTKKICPSDFDYQTKVEIESTAKEIHRIIGLSQYSCSDFVVARDGLYFLEINSLPELGQRSPFQKALNAVGDTHSKFITHLLEKINSHGGNDYVK